MAHRAPTRTASDVDARLRYELLWWIIAIQNPVDVSLTKRMICLVENSVNDTFSTGKRITLTSSVRTTTVLHSLTCDNPSEEFSFLVEPIFRSTNASIGAPFPTDDRRTFSHQRIKYRQRADAIDSATAASILRFGVTFTRRIVESWSACTFAPALSMWLRSRSSPSWWTRRVRIMS